MGKIFISFGGIRIPKGIPRISPNGQHLEVWDLTQFEPDDFC